MNLQERKDLLVQLGVFITSGDEAWQEAKQKAASANAWFIPEFIELSIHNISKRFLSEEAIQALFDNYTLQNNNNPKKIGIVMAGNIPLVGFHDLLCCFITGHYAIIKPSSKDEVLISFLVEKLKELNQNSAPYFTISERLKDCDAYIATGSNNSAQLFEYYFAKYPHIIRKNRTSIAILTGSETAAELELLADDVYQYFGLGCRNVTKIYVPRNFNFETLLKSFKKYNYLADYSKYKNNYDYNLAVHLLNKKYFMSNESLLLVEDSSLFSPIAQLHYEYYDDIDKLKVSLHKSENIQCIVGKTLLPFGKAQEPGICNFADGVDTIKFLQSLA